MNQQRFQEDQFDTFLGQIIDMELVEQPALGITKYAATHGYDALSVKQRHVFDNYVIRPYTIEFCKLCENPVPWEEMIFTEDTNGHCSYCANLLEKLERD